MTIGSARRHLVLHAARALVVDATKPAQHLLLVVAEDGEHVARARELTHVTHDGRRFGTAIDQVADEHQTIDARAIVHERHELSELVDAPVDVADGDRSLVASVRSHGRSLKHDLAFSRG
jgi:hypothetical protein